MKIMNIPENIYKIIENKKYIVDDIGQSGSKVFCFKDMVLKIQEQNEESDTEYKIMKWLLSKNFVPKIIAFEKSENMSYLLMSKIKGKMLCSSEFMENPKLLIKLLAKGLKMLWQTDISDCPCNSCLDNKLKLAKYRVENNLCSIYDVEEGTYGENGFDSPKHLFEWLNSNRPDENYVFSHGDYCLPNIFADKDKISGFIDLGRAGIADKYQDIALCYRSLKDNFYGKYSQNHNTDFDINLLFEELEINPDWDLIRYYIFLDELF